MGRSNVHVRDYTLERAVIDWNTWLRNWEWLLPREFTLRIVHRFGDLFIVSSDGTVLMLDVIAGTLENVAQNRDEFGLTIDDAEYADLWLVIRVVDRLTASGLTLGPGECYALRQPTILGGKYESGKLVVMNIENYLAKFGSIHEQLKDVPGGTLVIIRPSA
jgi:hypothetical protein